MGYNKTDYTINETKGYSHGKSAKAIGKKIGDFIESKKFIEAEEARKAETTITRYEEKYKSRQLTLLGRLCGYVEAFDGIRLEDQNIPEVEEIENPSQTKSFKEGYVQAIRLANAGLPKEKYYEQLEEYENEFIKSRGNTKK